MSKSIHCCADMHEALATENSALRFVPKFREYGIAVVDGGSSFIEIHYCPWCGKRLPESLRSTWFQRLEEEGVDPFGDDVPERYLDGRWYDWSMS
ncbi:DUF6980 family protein [Pelomonas caseinilytica]|uniref:DUF6980 family protein n=1 Tax=Pelomonas caseinilytica TaxID=2906763 RepID=UPI003B01D0C8